MGAREALRPPLTLPTGSVPVRGTRSALNAAHLMLHMENGGGNAGFRGTQNTAPSGVSRPFFGAGEHSLRLFLQEVRARTARPLPGDGGGQVVWRSLTGLGRRKKGSWPSGGSSFSWVVPGLRPFLLALTRSRSIVCRAALAHPLCPLCPLCPFTRFRLGAKSRCQHSPYSSRTSGEEAAHLRMVRPGKNTSMVRQPAISASRIVPPHFCS